MIFRKRKTAQDPKFILHGQTLDIVDTYSYLGIIFKYNGYFFETRKKLVEQANKALYCINSNISKACCISSFASDKITVSSAYKITKIL
jgi:hypothetical protein